MLHRLFSATTFAVAISCASALRGSRSLAEVSTLRLIDANTNQPVPGFESLQDGDIVYLYGQSRNFNVQATTVQSTSYVQFDNGRYEGVSPYARCGDNSGNYNSCEDLVPGVHTVSATAFSHSGQGGATYSVTFTIIAGSDGSPTSSPTNQPTSAPVVPTPVTDALAFKLIHTPSGKAYDITAGAVLDVTALGIPSNDFNVQAAKLDNSVQSVRFVENGQNEGVERTF